MRIKSIRMFYVMAGITWLLLAGCGLSTTSSSGNSAEARRTGAWASSGTPLDSGTVFDVTPHLAVQPNGGGGAMAVWIKRVDLDPADNISAVYHVYARHLTAGVPDGTDAACPAGGFPFGNPDATGNDGVCVIDTGTAQYDAWSPKVSMDNNGNAIVVWQQHDGTATRVYARPFVGGSWGAIQQLNDSVEFSNFDSADPAIALSPNPGSAMAAWSQYNEKDWTISLNSTATYTAVYSMAVSNGALYAGMGGAAGAGDIFAYDPGSGSWTLFLDNVAAYTRATSMIDFAGKLYVGYQGAAGLGDVASYDISTDTWTPVFFTGVPASNTGQYESVRSMAVYQCSACAGPQLYIGLGNSVGDADVYTCILCDGTDWVRVLDTVTNAFQAVTTMTVYNNQLYIGVSQTASVNAAVYRCSDCAGDASDWTQVFLDGTYNSVRSMAVHNGLIYIGMGEAGGDGDVWRCDFAATGCDQTTDWTQVLNSGLVSYQSVPSMVSYNGYLYIGMGENSAQNGDIQRCLICDGTDWTLSRNEGVAPFTPANYEAVNSLAAYGGELFAGFGNTGFDGDIWRFSAGWQTVARRFVNGIGWDTSDTVCPAGSGGNDGICYLSGGTGLTVQPTQSPRVAMDDSGRAIAAFIKMEELANCFAPPTVDPITVNYALTVSTINCMDSQIHANLFNGTWIADLNLDPDIGTTVGSVDSNNELICFQNSIGAPATRDNGGNSLGCVNVIEYDLTMSRSGQAALLIKTAWKENEDFGITPLSVGSCDNRDSGGACVPDENAFESFMGEAIVARQFDIATLGGSCPAWTQGNVAVCWSLNRLANFGIYPVLSTPDNITTITTPTAFGIGTFAGGCPSSITIDGSPGRIILNCGYTHPRIAIEPDGGGTAIAVYESYNGSTFDVQAHRFDGAVWSAPSPIDAGGGDAHAPQVAMDDTGNGVAVWTQNSGGQYRVDSNCYAPAAGLGTCGNVVSSGWQGASNVDGGVGSESSYYSPLISLSGPGGANSALSLFLGWSVLDNSTRLYSATGP